MTTATSRADRGRTAWTLVLLAVGIGWLIARWTATDGFTDRHRILLAGGALVGHTLFGIACGVADGLVVASPLVGAAVIVVTVFLLVRLDRRVAGQRGETTDRS